MFIGICYCVGFFVSIPKEVNSLLTPNFHFFHIQLFSFSLHCFFFFVQRKLCEVNTEVSHEPTDSWSLVSSGLSALANMAKDTCIRKKIADEQDWWETSVKFLVGIFTALSLTFLQPK